MLYTKETPASPSVEGPSNVVKLLPDGDGGKAYVSWLAVSEAVIVPLKVTFTVPLGVVNENSDAEVTRAEIRRKQKENSKDRFIVFIRDASLQYSYKSTI